NVPFNFLLYPNPANNLIHIITPVSGKTLVRVYNMLGSELIANSYTNQSNIDLAVSNLPNGVYLVRIQTDNGNSFIKTPCLICCNMRRLCNFCLPLIVRYHYF